MRESTPCPSSTRNKPAFINFYWLLLSWLAGCSFALFTLFKNVFGVCFTPFLDWFCGLAYESALFYMENSSLKNLNYSTTTCLAMPFS